MSSKLRWSTFALLFVLICFHSAAQPGPPGQTPKAEIRIPATPEQAQETFYKAWNFEKELRFADALAHYQAAMEYYQKNNLADYILITLGNMANIHAQSGEHLKAIETLHKALENARSANRLGKMAQFHHQIGLLLGHLAEVRSAFMNNPQFIYPDPAKVKDETPVNISSGTYTQLAEVEDRFMANYIKLGGSENPYERKMELYTKVIEVRVKGDFDPEGLLVPDQMEIDIKIDKEGYFPIAKRMPLPIGVEYTEFSERLQAIPRNVKFEITEDYREEKTVADEITLAEIKGREVGKANVVSEKDSFRPGVYQLSVRKAGYNPILTQITLYPGLGPFVMPVRLTSKLRPVVYRIQSDFMQLAQKDFVPDEIKLNNQDIRENSKVKPGQYNLVIRKEGYEPIVKPLVVNPDERQVVIAEFMKSLPRRLVFEISGDYADGSLVPDEVSLDGKFTKHGDAVRPEAYRLLIRKKGYDAATDRIVIEPSSQPYVLKRKLLSTPRPIDLNVMANFPPGRRIFPELASLDLRNITAEERFKPGPYKLEIRQGGYHPISKKMNIAPDEVPFRIDEILEAKRRQLFVEVSRDIAPEPDENLPTTISLVNDKNGETTQIKSGDEVIPESYTLKVQQPGYEIDSSKHVVFPSETPLHIDRRLIAGLRGLVTEITAEYPPNAAVLPDEITIDNRPLSKDFKIKPGPHDLVILKEGYLPIREPIRVLASPKEYLLKRRLDTRSRLVDFVFLDSYNASILEPDEVLLRSEKIAAGESQNLKPGRYDLKVRLRGYASLADNIEIPVGTGPLRIERLMVAIEREILPDITSDYTNDKLQLDQIDIFTLNNQPVAKMFKEGTRKICVIPGKYNLYIQKRGYDPVEKALTITPAPDAYLIQERLKSKRRELDIAIQSSFPYAPKDTFAPDALKLGVQEVRKGDRMKPGEYALLVQKRGYKTITEQIIIEPAEERYNIYRTLETLPRAVMYKIANDYDGQMVEPDLISINDRNIDRQGFFTPERYKVRIEKLGFFPKSLDFLLEPSDVPYVIETVLESRPRAIDLNVTADFPPDEVLDPDVATLDGKAVLDHEFKPGNYTLEILCEGFFPIKQNVTIDPGEDPYLIERVMESMPRLVVEAIEYDVPPPDVLAPYKITLAPSDNPTRELQIKNGDRVKPGEYVLRVTKEAYEPIEKKKHVWATSDPLEIAETLIAKQRTLFINITYDIKAPDSLPDSTVSLIDRTEIPRFVKHGNKSKPGEYKLKVERPGYSFGDPRPIYIQPSEEPYSINEKLLALWRPISFNIVDSVSEPGKNIMVPAYKVLNRENGQEVTYRDKFQPGKKVDLIFKFEDYKTVHRSFLIDPGDGPYAAEVPMVRLKRYDFRIRHEDPARPPYITLDGLDYPFVYYVDNEPIEDHHMKAQSAGGRWLYTIKAAKNAQSLQVFGGYQFIQSPLDQPGAQVPSFNAINVEKLVKHLQTIVQIPGRSVLGALDALDAGVRTARWRSMLQKANPEEISQLMQYVETWSGHREMTDNARVRLNGIIDRLDKVRTGQD